MVEGPHHERGAPRGEVRRPSCQYYRQVSKASLRTDKDRQRSDSTETKDLQLFKTIVIHLKVLVGHSQSEAERILTMRRVDRVFVVIVLCPEKEKAKFRILKHLL